MLPASRHAHPLPGCPRPAAPLQEALRRAIEQDPSLLQQHPELQSVADRAAAEGVKAQGNAAFAAGKLEEAVALFTRCIELDGGNAIYHSNRAAAHAGLKDHKAAARDARRATELKPGWAKAWSRLGAAYFGLEQFSEVGGLCGCEGWGWGVVGGAALQGALDAAARCDALRRAAAYHTGSWLTGHGTGAPIWPCVPHHPCLQAREAYERACKLEPNDAQLQVSLQRAAAREAKQIAEHKHTFKRKLEEEEAGGGGGGGRERGAVPVRPSAAKKERTLLSFGGDEEEEA